MSNPFWFQLIKQWREKGMGHYGVSFPFLIGALAKQSGSSIKQDEIVNRRYNGNFSDFDVAPEVDYSGDGVKGKQTARGLEQRGFEKDGGLKGTSNKQNPVGSNNKNRQKYLDAADENLGKKIAKGCKK